MYKTIKAESIAEFVEKKSRFIGHIAPVATVDEATAFIEKISKQHYNATHNVFAYMLKDGNISRCSDNGEPQGTAGVPVLDVIKKEGLVDVCIVATRYFGGTMLGAGGLVRAYSHTASIAVSSAEVLTMISCVRFSLTCDYSFYGTVSYVAPQFGVKIENSDFLDAVTLTLLAQDSDFEQFKQHIFDISNGTVSCNIIEQIFYAKEWF